jgi:catechol 2,3-dioxygenase-like lactoylglutathione lyase family enzyme
MVIDLLEWVSPRDDSDPYPNLHRPGLARLAMRTTDLAADYATLEAEGVEILSAPATVMTSQTRGTRFFCFRDPDGTFLELVESVTITAGD